MKTPILVTAPAELPISLERLKSHLRIDDAVGVAEDEASPPGEEDDTLTALLAAAVSHLDGYTGILGRCIMLQTWEQEFDALTRCMRLPLPAINIVEVKCMTLGGDQVVLSQALYSLQHDGRGSFVNFDGSTAVDLGDGSAKSIAVRFTSGHANAADVPAAIKQALLLLVAHWYAHREAVVTGTIATSLPFAVEALIAPWRRIGV
jgi:uncharacterized phiE125 gp8 family phage protein